jgi:hypothetical protein
MNFKKLRQMITVKGNGHTTTKEYAISSFLHLHLSADGNVELHQGEEEKIIIETDKNLLDYIGITNSGKTLFISPEAGYRRIEFSTLRIKVYFRQLNKLHICFEEGEVNCANAISGTGSLELKLQGSGPVNLNIDVPVLKALIQHKGDVTLSGTCTEAEIKTQADGDLNSKDLIAQNLVIKNYSEGNVEACATETISISQYGRGFIYYWGNARLVHMNQRGNGIVKHIK